jgi:hypothetical protein
MTTPPDATRAERFEDSPVGWPASEAFSVRCSCPSCDWVSPDVPVEHDLSNAVWHARSVAADAYRTHFAESHRSVPQPLWEYLP